MGKHGQAIRVRIKAGWLWIKVRWQRIKTGLRNEKFIESVKALGTCTAAIGICFGVATYHFNKEKEASDRLLNIITLLDNNKCKMVRAGAASTMGVYLREYKEYQNRASWVMASNLATEEDPLVRDTILNILRKAGAEAIEPLACRNRFLLKEEMRRVSSLQFGVDLVFQIDLDNGRISDALTDEFKNNGLPLGEDVTVLIEEKGDRWLIYDRCKKETYSVKEEGDELNIYSEVNSKDALPLPKKEHFSLASSNHNLSDIMRALVNVLEKKSFPKKENLYLSEIVLSNLDSPLKINLDETNLKQANLRQALLEGVSLKQTDLTEANLEGAVLQNVDLTGAKLLRANLLSISLEGEDNVLDDADLAGALLSNADLRGGRFTNANLVNAKLRNVKMEGVGLEGVDFSKADLTDANLPGARLMGATMVKTILKCADLKGANLNTSILNDAHLERATLVGSSLKDANLEGANLIDTDLSMADLRGAYLSNANLAGADLSGANLEGADLKNANLKAKVLFRIDPNMFQSDLDQSMISEDLKQEFENKRFYLSQNTAISIKKKGSRWLINDKDNKRTYIVRKEELLNICKVTKFDFEGIKKAKNWKKAVFDGDVKQKLFSQKD